MVDIWVLNSQRWLNNTYGSKPGYNTIAEDGSTGWETMFGLTRALQIELGITDTSDTFGPTTMSKLTSKFGTIGTGFTKNKNLVTIIQCALWCKGYWGGDVTDAFGATVGVFSETVASSVAAIRADMGLPADQNVPPKIFKSLLTLDAYVTINGGDPVYRSIQQQLNGRYWQRADFRIMPCDGIYSRDVQQGLMYAIQYEIGMADGVANGNFGPATQQGIKDHGVFGLGASDGARRMVSLFTAALCFNGYTPGSGFGTTFSAATASATRAFQAFVGLAPTGTGNYATWASLLVSTGDPERAATACDTATPLSATTAATLVSSGYRAVGRYLNGSSKGIKPTELDTIFTAGLGVFPIYQEWNNLEEISNQDPEPGTQRGPYGFGVRQGKAAVLRARQLGFTAGTTIYFPVDDDATAAEIEAAIIPYFQGVRDGVATSQTVKFVVGSYGPRNVCLKIHEAALAHTSFVAGLSTGWSANLGFPLPANWAFDQIKEYTIGSGAGSIGIDKDVASERSTAVTRSQVVPTPTIVSNGQENFDTAFHWHLTSLGCAAEAAGTRSALWPANVFNDFVLHWLQERAYGDAQWRLYAPLMEMGLAVASGGSSPIADEITVARAVFKASQSGDRAEAARQALINSYEGDLEHFAAALRGLLTWGSPRASRNTEIGDLGGWALDLVQVWANFQAAGASTLTTSVHDWMVSTIGSTSRVSGFGRKDLVADVDAYIASRWLQTDPDRPISDVMRSIRSNARADSQWRYRFFVEERFGGSADNIENAVRYLFSTSDLTVKLPALLTLKDLPAPTEDQMTGLATAVSTVFRGGRPGYSRDGNTVRHSTASSCTVLSAKRAFDVTRAAGRGVTCFVLVSAWLAIAYCQTTLLISWQPLDRFCRVSVDDEAVLTSLAIVGDAAVVLAVVFLWRKNRRTFPFDVPIAVTAGLAALALVLGVSVTMAYGLPLETPRELLWFAAVIAAVGAPSLSVVATSVFLWLGPAGHFRRTMIVALLLSLCPVLAATTLVFAAALSPCLA